MNRRHLLLAACLFALLGPRCVHGQRRTERYIPIGRSPGASGVSTRIGTVAAVDAGARAIELAAPDGRVRVALPEGTPIWIDRSRQQRATLDGAFDDLKTGRRVEVKYAGPGRTGRVGWIKVESTE